MRPTLVAVCVLSLVAGCGDDGGGTPVQDTYDLARAAALAHVQAELDDDAYLGLYLHPDLWPAGTELADAEDDSLLETLSADAYIALVDDHPGAVYAHDVRWLVIDAATQAIDEQARLWPPVLDGVVWVPRHDATDVVVDPPPVDADDPFVDDPDDAFLTVYAPLSIGKADGLTGKRKALVLQGGTETWMVKTSENIGKLLGKLGFAAADVTTHVPAAPGVGGAAPTPQAVVDAFKKAVTDCCATLGADDKFYLLIAGHGSVDLPRFNVYDMSVRMTYADLASHLKTACGHVGKINLAVQPCGCGAVHDAICAVFEDNDPATDKITVTSATDTASGFTRHGGTNGAFFYHWLLKYACDSDKGDLDDETDPPPTIDEMEEVLKDAVMDDDMRWEVFKGSTRHKRACHRAWQACDWDGKPATAKDLVDYVRQHLKSLLDGPKPPEIAEAGGQAEAFWQKLRDALAAQSHLEKAKCTTK